MLSKDERDRLCTLYAKTTEGAWYPRATDDEVFMNARYVSTEPGPELYGNETMVHDGRRGMDYAHCDCGKVVCITLLQSPRLADVDDARWDDNTIFIAESHNAFPKLLDAIDALEAERDALAARVAQHEREEELWKARERSLSLRAAQAEHERDNLRAELEVRHQWPVQTMKRVKQLEAICRNLITSMTIARHSIAQRQYVIDVNDVRDDPVEAARRALEGTGDARE